MHIWIQMPYILRTWWNQPSAWRSSWDTTRKKGNNMGLRKKILIGMTLLILVMSAEANTFITNSYITVQERISTYNGVAGGSYVGQFSNKWMDRSFWIFALPDMAGKTLVSATFRVSLALVDGAANDVDLYHIQDLNHGDPLVTNDFNAGTATLVKASFVTPSSVVGYYSVDVLNEILSDYSFDSSGERYAVFRAQLEGDEKISGTANRRYNFISNNNNTNPDQPELILEITEGRSISLIIVH